MYSHHNFSTKLPNDWSLITEFVIFNQKTEIYETADVDFIELDKLEKLHYQIAQYFKDFGELPKIGDDILSDDDVNKVVEREINLKEKKVTISLK